MSKLVIVVPTGRGEAGRGALFGGDGTLRLAPFRVVATASAKVASQNGNPTRDWRRPYGHTPTGSYVVASALPPCSDTGPELCAQHRPPLGALVLSPVGGNALEALRAGRTRFLVHGGRPDPEGRLRLTFGGIRVSDSDLASLLAALNEASADADPVTSVEVEETSTTPWARGSLDEVPLSRSAAAKTAEPRSPGERPAGPAREVPLRIRAELGFSPPDGRKSKRGSESLRQPSRRAFVGLAVFAVAEMGFACSGSDQVGPDAQARSGSPGAGGKGVQSGEGGQAGSGGQAGAGGGTTKRPRPPDDGGGSGGGYEGGLEEGEVHADGGAGTEVSSGVGTTGTEGVTTAEGTTATGTDATTAGTDTTTTANLTTTASPPTTGPDTTGTTTGTDTTGTTTGTDTTRHHDGHRRHRDGWYGYRNGNGRNRNGRYGYRNRHGWHRYGDGYGRHGDRWHGYRYRRRWHWHRRRWHRHGRRRLRLCDQEAETSNPTGRRGDGHVITGSGSDPSFVPERSPSIRRQIHLAARTLRAGAPAFTRRNLYFAVRRSTENPLSEGRFERALLRRLEQRPLPGLLPEPSEGRPRQLPQGWDSELPAAVLLVDRPAVRVLGRNGAARSSACGGLRGRLAGPTRQLACATLCAWALRSGALSPRRSHRPLSLRV